MSAIRPELPPHLLNGAQDNIPSDGEDASPHSSTEPVVGPQIPPHLVAGPSKQAEAEENIEEKEESDSDDDYGPALPPELVAARAGSSSSTRLLGPSLPQQPSPFYEIQNYDRRRFGDDADDDSDDDVGPMPLPTGISFDEEDGVREFMEREERRRKQLEEAAKPKTLKRDEWMLVPPSSSDLLGSLDPTKLKARQFSRSAAPAKKVDNTLWTETPAERQQRIADEVSGKKRRAANAPEEEPDPDAIKRMRRDEGIRREVEAHTRIARNESLLDLHKSTSSSASKDKDEKFEGIWDRDRDMSIGGRLMDEKARSKMVKDAKSLGDRFGTGKSGSFL